MGSQALASLHLHTAPVSSIDSDPSGSMLITASWDNLIGVWSTSIPEVDDAGAVDAMVEKRSRKRRKTDGNLRKKAPLEVLRSHTHRISQVKFTTDKSAVSCGWDSTIRTWDISTGVCDGTLTAAEKPFTSLAIHTKGQIFVNSTDRTLSFYDLSQRANSSGPQLMFMHPATPSCISKSPSDSWRVLTGAYDGVVRIWDTRSAKTAVSSFQTTQQGKVLSADWGRGMVLLGGERGMDIWRISEDGTVSVVNEAGTTTGQ
jgi:ribosome biogenesis protein YTM1